MANSLQSTSSYQDKLLALLGEVDRPGTFYTFGDAPVTMPGLDVDGVGAIRLPLGKTQARKLIRACAQAPYGKGTETVVDTDVRRVWELDPERFSLTNPRWNDLVLAVAATVRNELGLHECELVASLYKLLVYEEGSFFLPHRDGEKLDRMVATLVITLPSSHSGGELVVTHEGERIEIPFSGAASGHEISYAAFYADCEHEVLPVREGYRLSLIYNLTLAGSGKKKRITAPRNDIASAEIAGVLREWMSEAKTAKLAISLDHQYTKDGLNIDTLKGVDRSRADVLFSAADQANCVAHLALMTHWQHGASENDDEYSYGGNRYRRWSYDEDDDEDDDGTSPGSTNYEMGEVYDESLSIDHWSDRSGNAVSLGTIDLSRDEIVSSQGLQDWEVSEEEYEGYTGNAGMTLDRWYHRAAVVVWPQSAHFRILCDAGTDAAISGFESLVAKTQELKGARKEQQLDSCREFAKAIMGSWTPWKSYRYTSTRDLEHRSMFLKLLLGLDDPELIGRFLEKVAPEDGGVPFDRSFAKFCKRHGWQTFADPLMVLVDSTTIESVERNATLLELLCTQRDQNGDRLELCRRLADRLLTALETIDRDPPNDRWYEPLIEYAPLMVSLVKALVAIQATSPLKRLVDHAFAHRDRYDLIKVHMAAITKLASWLARKSTGPDPAAATWLRRCRNELKQRTARLPQPPADMRRRSELSCSCADCQELKRFLDDPHESVHRFPMRTDRRQHLQSVIRDSHCDLTHVTTRNGNPHSLVCTKTQQSYEEACETYQQDQALLKRLAAIEEKIGHAGGN